MSLLNDFLNGRGSPNELDKAVRETNPRPKLMGKTTSEQLIAAHRKSIGKIAVSGLTRLLERSSTEISAIAHDGGYFTLAIHNESGEATVRIPDNLPAMIAHACISGPSQEMFEQVRDNPWQADSGPGPKPISVIPVNAAIWKLAGIGEEVVDIVRNDEFNYEHHIDRYHYELAQVGRLFGVLDKKTSNDYAMAVSSQIQPARRAIMGWIRHEWKTFGTTTPVRNEIKRLILRDANLSANNLMVMASFFCDAGDYGYAIELLHKASQKSKNIWKSTRIPAITHLLVREGFLTDEWAKNEAEIVESVIRMEDDFPTLIRNNRSSFAIVANGPRQIGMGTGPEIDKKEVVIRLNSGRPTAQFSPDYGWKQNVWVKNQQNYDVKRMDRLKSVDRLILSGGNPLYRTSNNGIYIQELVDNYEKVSLIPERFLRETITKTQRNPSSGIVMITWLDHLVGNLQDQVNVFGYSLNDQKTRQTKHYYRSDPIISHHNHNWDAEREYFDTVVKPAT